jgi:hypothetical protein
MNACSPKILPSSESNNEKTLAQSSQILYLTLDSQKDTIQNNISIKIIQYQIIEGTLKHLDDAIELNETPGSWKISLTNAKGQILCSQFILNPFIFRTEAFSEHGTIEQKTIAVSHAQIPMRFPYLKQMKKIQIDTLALSNKTITIFQQEFETMKIQ